jgi:hypothetical protein
MLRDLFWDVSEYGYGFRSRDFVTPRNDKAYAVELALLPSAACAAARRAIGTRNGEHDT